MSSQEIERSVIDWLKEIAFQLAVMDETKNLLLAEMDSSRNRRKSQARRRVADEKAPYKS